MSTPNATGNLDLAPWQVGDLRLTVFPSPLAPLEVRTEGKRWEALVGKQPENVMSRNFATEIEEFHNLGSGVTWSILVLRSRPHGSDSFVEARPAIVTLWRCDRIERATNYTDIDAARAAAERLAQERG